MRTDGDPQVKKFAGSCNCGAVTYRVNGEIKRVVNCHCGLCRKMNGGAFSTYVIVLEKDFALQSGNLQSCQVSEKATRHTCARCSTPVFNANAEYDGLKILYLGSVDDVRDIKPQVNIYNENKLDWLATISDLHSFEEGPD